MLSWQIGDVKVTRVVEMHTDAPHDGPVPFILDATPDALKAMPWLYPDFVTPEGLMKISIHALLVDAPGHKTGCRHLHGQRQAAPSARR